MNILGSSANSHDWLHAGDALEVFQEVLGELVWMGLVSSVVREEGKLNGEGLEIVGHYGSALLWCWYSSRSAVTETLADD